jgi:NADPH2 dehydrogenase
MERPDAMSAEGIVLWKTTFLEAIRRAKTAGFDLVEFHAAHGYGLNQWLSPITNQRTDAYGGSLENNTRLLFEIIEDAKRIFPELLFAVRMPGQDFLEGGLQPSDSIWIARELEKRGLDIIDVSSGIGGWRRPRDRTGEGYLVAEAAILQSAVSIPVIGVGGIETGDFILAGAQAWGDANLI